MQDKYKNVTPHPETTLTINVLQPQTVTAFHC